LNIYPKTIKLYPFARKEFSFNGLISFDEFDKLSSIIGKQAGNVECGFSLYLKDEKIPVIKGFVSAKVFVECQRCLNKMPQKLHSNFLIAFVDEQQEIGLDKTIDTLNFQEELFVIDFLTDELLLNLPMITKHDDNCNIEYEKMNLKTLDKEEKKENPFNILKSLKK